MSGNEPSIGVGMPHWFHLNIFGRIVFDAFGAWPYLVGSAAVGKQWRDVDVRLILSGDEYARVLGEWDADDPEARRRRWSALCMAFSELGKHMTGLPVDFQIQERDSANEMFPDQVRMALIQAAEASK